MWFWLASVNVMFLWAFVVGLSWAKKLIDGGNIYAAGCGRVQGFGWFSRIRTKTKADHRSSKNQQPKPTLKNEKPDSLAQFSMKSAQPY